MLFLAKSITNVDKYLMETCGKKKKQPKYFIATKFK